LCAKAASHAQSSSLSKVMGTPEVTVGISCVGEGVQQMLDGDIFVWHGQSAHSLLRSGGALAPV